MVKRIIAIFNKEFGSINEAALLLGFFAFLSQILGLVRDKIFAHNLGASAPLDIYVAAFRIPDFLYVSIASFASVTIILPFLIEKTRDGGNTDAEKFLNSIFTVFSITIFILSVLIFLLMPQLAHFLVPGFSEEMLAQFIPLARIMLLSPILLGFSNLFGAVTQLYKRFFVFALAPLLYNIGIILGLVFLYPSMGIEGLGWGVVFGAFLHMSIQVPGLVGSQLMPRFTAKINWSEIRQVVLISLPRTLALSSNNIALLAITAIGSTLGIGALSVFTYSYHLQTVPLALIGVSYSVAAFPALAHYFAERNMSEFIRNIMLSARQIIFWSMPVIFLFIVLRAQIVRVILGSGQFSWDDTRLTAAALALFAISVVAQSLVLLFVRGFYAAGNTRIPLFVNVATSGIIVIASILLIQIYTRFPEFKMVFDRLLRVDGIEGTGILMLPLGYTIGSLLNGIYIWLLFRRSYLEKSFYYGLSWTFFESISASIALGVSAYYTLDVFDTIFDISTFWGILAQGAVAGIAGIIAWAFVLEMLKSEELARLKLALSHKIFKIKPIASPHEETIKQ